MAGLIGFDLKKADKAKVAAGLRSLADAAKPCFSGLVSPAVNVVIDGAVGKAIEWVNNYISPVTFQATPEDIEKAETIQEAVVTILQGEHVVHIALTQEQATTFLAKFAGKVPQANLDFAAANPDVAVKLKAIDRKGRPVFSEAQQEKILANIDWMKILMEVAPIILKLLLMFI